VQARAAGDPEPRLRIRIHLGDVVFNYLSIASLERVNKAIEQFKQPIKLDPDFALPSTGLDDAY
jgi:hypothetical protein